MANQKHVLDLRIQTAIQFAQLCDQLCDQVDSNYLTSEFQYGRAIRDIGYSYNASQGTNLEVRPKYERLLEIPYLSEEDKERIEDFVNQKEGRIKSLEGILSLFGDSLEVINISHPQVQENLSHLGFIPEGLVQRLLSEGMKVEIGPYDVIGLTEDEYYKTHSPRGWVNKNDWSNVPGCWDPNEKTAYIGTGVCGSISVTLHEVGHGIGYLLGLNKKKKVIQAHNRLFSQLIEYEQQGGPGGTAGREEFLAESVAALYMLSQSKFVDRYDAKWYSFLNRELNF